MSRDSKPVADLLRMCTDSEQRIAKLEWLYQHRMFADANEMEALRQVIQTLGDVHASLRQAYETASARKFESKMSAYRKRLTKRLSN